MDLPARKLLNLTLEWFMSVVDPDDWEREYKDLFFGDPVTLEMERERKKRVKPAVPGQEATWAIRRPDTPRDDMQAAGVKIPGLRRAEPGDDSPASGPSFSVGDDGEMTVS